MSEQNEEPEAGAREPEPQPEKPAPDASDAAPGASTPAAASSSESGPASAKKKLKKKPSTKVTGVPIVTDEGALPAPDPFAAAATALPAAPAYGLAFLSGFLYFLAFPGIDIWPLAFVALVPLIVALRGQTAKRALGLGWLAGFTMTMFGFYWLMEMLKTFSGFPLPLCVLFMALLCAAQAGRIALCGWLYGRADRRGWPAAPAFALAFVASELVFPLLFPWYYAATVHNAPVFLQLADLGGPYLVSVVLIAVNLALAELVIVFVRKEPRALDRRVLYAGVGALGAALLYGALRIHQVDAKAAVATPVKIGIVQGNLPLLARSHGLQNAQKATADLKARGAELVLWSEGGSGTAHRESPNEEEARKAVSTRLGVPTIIGTLLVRPGPSREHPTLFNTALLATDGGKIVGRYDKQYLLAFGEYLPFGEQFPQLYEMSPNSSRFSSGTSLEPLVWGDHRISALICYEDILPSFVNKMVHHADPDLIVNLTNDTWFGDSTEPYIHFALAKLRAVEHRRYLVRATNSGLSGIIDPIGRTILHGKTWDEEALLGEARFLHATTGYEILGDYPWYLLTLGIVFMAFRRREQWQ
jgi:apolipoprotein N-acyltransferase